MPRKKLWPDPTISGFFLANFKGFGSDGCHIPLRPLTLIYGPNSGGKSTVLKGLSSISQSKAQGQVEGSSQDWVSAGPWFDLGSENQVLHQPRGRKNPNKEFTIGFSSVYHRANWSKSKPIKPTFWETGTPILNLTMESETMKRIEEIFDLFAAEGYDGLESSIPGFTSSSILGMPNPNPLHSAVFLDLWKDNPHYENDLRAYSCDKWPDGFEHHYAQAGEEEIPIKHTEEFNLLKSHIWFILLGSILDWTNNLGPTEDNDGEIDPTPHVRMFLRSIKSLHVSSLSYGHANIDFHWDFSRAKEQFPELGKMNYNQNKKHGYTTLNVDLGKLRKFNEAGPPDTIKPQDPWMIPGMCNFSDTAPRTYGPKSSIVFDLPSDLTRNSIFLLRSSSSAKAPTSKDHTFAFNENSDYTLDEASGLIESDKIMVNNWEISEGRIYLNCDMSNLSFQKPVLYTSPMLKFDNRLDLIFSYHSSGYSLKGIDFHEVRGGSLHKLISGKSIDWDSEKRPLLFTHALSVSGAKENQSQTVLKVSHHQYPDLLDQDVPAKDVQEISEYSKTVEIVARIFLPLLYGCRYNIEDDSLALQPLEDNQKSAVEGFYGAGSITAEEIIELVNEQYKEQKQTLLTKRERKAIRNFCVPGSPDHIKTKWMTREFIQNLVKPQHMKINGVSQQSWAGSIQDPTQISRAKLVSVFGIDKKELIPRIAIPVGIYRSELYRFAQTTMHVLPPAFYSMYARFHQILNLVADESGKIDYLSASRLAPRRYYAQADHDSSASATGRTLANLNSKFPRGSPNLTKLNELMVRIVGMEVSFGKLRSTDGQETNLLDIRVGRPGSRKKFAQLPDVGYGVSQTLPLIAAIVDTGESSPDTTLVIEEAESNLHPAAQSRLMDAILENLNTDLPSPKIILETHSEHFLMTVQRHLKEGGLDIEDEDIAILYVDNDNPEGTTEVHHMETRKGDFLSPWPRENWDDPTSPII